MPTNTGGGTTTSLNNTPQAQGDTYTETEDFSGVTYFDVMANDLGGNAKVLWSVDDGLNSPTALIVQDAARAESTLGDHSVNGANIRITAAGKGGYDSTTLGAGFEGQVQ